MDTCQPMKKFPKVTSHTRGDAIVPKNKIFFIDMKVPFIVEEYKWLPQLKFKS